MNEHTWRFMSLVFSFLILTVLVALGSLLIMGSLDFANWERDLLLNLGTELLGGALLFWMISLGWESYRSWTDSKATPLIDRQQTEDIYKLQMRVEVMSEQLVMRCRGISV